MGNSQKKDSVIENMKAASDIDVNVKFKIPRSPFPFDETKHKYKCSSCGKGFTSQNGNFQKSFDVLFQANNGYLPWCRECSDVYMNQVTALYSYNEELAIKNFCQRAGWNYDKNALVASMESYDGNKVRSRISHYASKKNLNCGGRKTYIDSIKYSSNLESRKVINSKKDIKSKTQEFSVANASIDRWETGLTEWDYGVLDSHYRMLKRNNPNADNNQEIFIKALCHLYWLQIKTVRQANCDPAKYSNLVEQYNKTFKQSGLVLIEEKDSSNDDTFCMTLGLISEYTPEEFYLDKKLYSDFDKIGEYMERHILRPMINLETGSETRDNEFFIPEEEGEDEEE